MINHLSFPKGSTIQLEYPKGHSFHYCNGTYEVLEEGLDTLDIVKLVDGKPQTFDCDTKGMKHGNIMYSVIGKGNIHIKK